MERFHLINQAENNEDFVGMDKFWISISKNNSINAQNRFSPFEDKLDFFYICLLIGLKNETKENLSNYKVVANDQITDKWTRKLRETKAVDYIIGLYLSKSTQDCKNDKSKINIILNKVLDHNSDTKLSKDGMIEIHEYALGGYKLILKDLENNTPSTLVKFFNVIYNLVK
jgi:hypothetical protein|tara:strand:- start:1006 stop:1518 length:513 start_codon:yes stop_codon:yes gene_type:complete